MIFKTMFYIFLVTAIFSCSSNKNTRVVSDSSGVDHTQWTELLEKYVDENGLTDYAGLQQDKEALLNYTTHLSQNPPAESWNKDDQLAYWINAYNAFTVLLIVENYPIESIKDLNPSFSIPTIRSVWTKDWFKIGEEDFSLDRIEHKILRKAFDEPRIHFAINCASISCPILRSEAYYGHEIDKQLNEQARLFINDPSRNILQKDEVKLSLVFNWFGGDFKKGQSLIQFINRYADIEIDNNAKISFVKYDWNLNDKK
jgi:hypothetical protein